MHMIHLTHIYTRTISATCFGVP